MANRRVIPADPGAVTFTQEDGSVWQLFANLELRRLKPPNARRAATLKKDDDNG